MVLTDGPIRRVEDLKQGGCHQRQRDRGRYRDARHAAMHSPCQRWVIRYRWLRDENLSMSAMPRKRRSAVKASSVAMGHLQTFERTSPVRMNRGIAAKRRLGPTADMVFFIFASPAASRLRARVR